jgi:hypothetical protein
VAREDIQQGAHQVLGFTTARPNINAVAILENTLQDLHGDAEMRSVIAFLLIAKKHSLVRPARRLFTKMVSKYLLWQDCL